MPAVGLGQHLGEENALVDLDAVLFALHQSRFRPRPACCVGVRPGTSFAAVVDEFVDRRKFGKILGELAIDASRRGAARKSFARVAAVMQNDIGRASAAAVVRFGFFGSLASRSAPPRQNFVPAAASRLKLPPNPRPALIQAAAGFRRQPGMLEESTCVVADQSARAFASRSLPYALSLDGLFCATVFPGHWHRSAMMHFSHSGLRARQV